MTDNNKWKIFFTDYVLKENILNFKREIEDNKMLYDSDIFIMLKEPTSTIYKKLPLFPFVIVLTNFNKCVSILSFIIIVSSLLLITSNSL